MVCVGGITSTADEATTLSDTWLFELKLTATDSTYLAYGVWTLLPTWENPLGPRHSFVMVNSPRLTISANSNLEGFVVYGGSSSTACMGASESETAQSWALSDVWMLVTSGSRDSLTAAWLQPFPLPPATDEDQVHQLSRSAAAGAMVNDTFLVFGGHTPSLSPSAEMLSSTISLDGHRCLSPSTTHSHTHLDEDCLAGAQRVNLVVQVDSETLALPNLKASNVSELESCGIRVHLQAAGVVIPYDTMEQHRCATLE